MYKNIFQNLEIWSKNCIYRGKLAYQISKDIGLENSHNRRSGVALAMCHRLKWSVHLRAQRPCVVCYSRKLDAHEKLLFYSNSRRDCRVYAENIRMRLTSNGLTVELMPVRGGAVDMNAVLASAVQDAVRQRSLFACIINEQNEMHRSMTVNILHGQLQGYLLVAFCQRLIIVMFFTCKNLFHF